jgi:hypothetical protein
LTVSTSRLLYLGLHSEFGIAVLDYYNAGTLVSAISGLAQDTTIAAKKVQNEIQNFQVNNLDEELYDKAKETLQQLPLLPIQEVNNIFKAISRSEELQEFTRLNSIDLTKQEFVILSNLQQKLKESKNYALLNKFNSIIVNKGQ